jgi:phage-related protein
VPILVAPGSVVPETPTVPEIEATQLDWISASGEIIRLTDWYALDSGLMVMPGVLGHLMPSWEFYSDTSPAFDGESIRGVRAGPRNITVPVLMWGPDRNTCLDIFHRLISSLNPRNGIGTLVFTEPSGRSYSIQGYYASGFEGDDNDDETGRHWITAVLVFRCPRPYFEGDIVSYTWQLAETPGNFFPFFPLNVSPSQVLGSLEIVNIGDAEAFPIWDLSGPYTSITLENLSTGKSLIIAKDALAGQVAVIDTTEGVKTAVLDGSTNLYEWMSLTSSLWPLRPGSNQISISLSGATTGASATLTYRPRYLAGV